MASRHSPPFSRATIWHRTRLAAALAATLPVAVTVGATLGLTLAIVLTGVAIGASAHYLTRAFVAWSAS